MDRGSRLVTLMQSLEKLHGQRTSSGKQSPEDLQQYRYITSKVLQYVAAPEKVHRDMIIKNSGFLDQLMVTLECTEDPCVEQNVIHIINELLGKSHTGKRASTLVSHGATQMLFTVLVYESRDQSPPEDLLLLIHQVLAKLGPKDRKFGVKARLSQALPVTLNLLKLYLNNLKALQPILHVLKLYANNAVNASYLGKNGAVSYLFKVLSLCGRKHLILLKHSLDTLTQMVKSKSNSARAIGQGGVPILLNMFNDWHRVDSKNRHISLRKAILNVLKHITNLKSGRKALMEADGIRILYTNCQDANDCRELEGIILASSVIMRKCFPRNKLPLSALRSSIVYDLPQSEFHVIDNGEGQDSALLTLIGQSSTGDDDYESSVDNDDDISSDDDDADANKGDSEEDSENNLMKKPPERTKEDLRMYEEFFQELFEFDKYVEEEEVDPSESYLTSDVRGTQSASALDTSPSRISSNRHSLPNLGLIEDDASLSRVVQNLRVGSSLSHHESANAASGNCQGMTHNIFRPRSQTGDRQAPDLMPASAVNVKTGASVFTLDISQAKLANRSPKLKRKGLKGQKKATRDKKSTSSKVDRDEEALSHDSHALCITPMLSSKDPSLDYGNLDILDPDDPEADPIIQGLDSLLSPEVYADIASRTISAGRFNKVAYPEMHGHLQPPFKEPLHEKKFGVQRGKIFEDIDRMIHPDQIVDRVAYDLDVVVSRSGTLFTSEYSNHSNRDEIRVSRQEVPEDTLKFNSQFESGNLRKAIQVRAYEYDLILSPDINTNHHHQWFYFEVSNMEADQPYRFNIVNCEKINSQFNFGMRPLMYSVTEAMQGRPHWVRCGTQICYYKNHFIRSSQTTGGVRGKSYYTGTFTLKFKHDRDVCYLAYHYPYTYSMLQAHLYQWENRYDAHRIYFKNQVLTETISGNPVPVLTITSYPQSLDREGVEQLKNRPYIFLSSRVHPGESNSSWVMRGTINYLLSRKPSAQALRDMYIFKIVPMLNPDGVINGNHRCSLVAEDLNRRWLNPCPQLHPTIYHTKGLLQYLYSVSRSPLVYCDYHGHSRRKNVFLYGCSPSLSWMVEDLDNPAMSGNKVEDIGYKTLPRILQNTAPAFSLSNCSFMVEKPKEATARVVVWRQIGVIRSYTMESTYCGCDQGSYKGQHISTRVLEEMGRKFCEALSRVRSRHIRMPNVNSTEGSTRSDQASIPTCGPSSQISKESLLEGATALDTGSDLNQSSGSTDSDDTGDDDEEEEEPLLD